MNQPTTSRGSFAVILATASITLALGVTTAALTGNLGPRLPDPEATIAPAAPTTDPGVEQLPPLPPEQTPSETQLAWAEQPGDDDDDHEHREHGGRADEDEDDDD